MNDHSNMNLTRINNKARSFPTLALTAIAAAAAAIKKTNA
jgi:hypothetical protein